MAKLYIIQVPYEIHGSSLSFNNIDALNRLATVRYIQWWINSLWAIFSVFIVFSAVTAFSCHLKQKPASGTK